MPMSPVPAVTLTPVAYFPEKYFLENLAVRADGSVLITAIWQKELWCVPDPEPHTEVRPVLLYPSAGARKKAIKSQGVWGTASPRIHFPEFPAQRVCGAG